ncbi:MAG: 23S rRNA (guanosine2251-2'-O)-methyltransferase [Myxococcota bacterium]|jgi:23S rRNA (guanosine2251-2'-O)-methyltransferase
MQRDEDKLEGRNVVIEALRRRRRLVTRVLLDERAKDNPKIRELLALVESLGTPMRRVPRKRLDGISETGVHNGVIAYAEPLPLFTVRDRMEALFEARQDPFFILADELNYEHNLGAILRSAMGAGVHAVVVPVRRGKGLTPVVQRVAMGGAEEVPLIREGISSSLTTLRRGGIPIVGADMDGDPPWSVRLTGPVAIVLGGEDKGLTAPVRKKCDAIVGIPLAGGLDSLNVSVTAGILMFEKRRQDAALRSTE